MFLGIEIGGTKLQLGIGSGDGRPLVALERLAVQPEHGAEGIRRQIATAAKPLVDRYAVKRIGFGFGGPVDAAKGRTITSHQIEGWQDYPLADWGRRRSMPSHCGQRLRLRRPGRGPIRRRSGASGGFHSNVGSGIGGALVIDGQLYQGGHGVASGWPPASGPIALVPTKPPSRSPVAGGSRPACSALANRKRRTGDAADLISRCGGRIEGLNTF